MGFEPTTIGLEDRSSTIELRPRRYAWWAGEDSNLRRLRQQIYSLSPLAAREPARRSHPHHLRRPAPPSRPAGQRHNALRLPGVVGGLELVRGLEPLTCGLQNRCSAIELH